MAKILRVDLSRKSYKVDTLPDGVLRRYIGGRGLGAYLLATTVPPHTDPLGKDNHLIFSAGPGNGTELMFGSKAVVTTKSPLTNIYAYAIASGSFAHKLRKAGFWALDITGIAKSPVYMVVHNDKVTFEDAAPLWGMEVAAAQRRMRGDLPYNRAATIAIGTAGENLIRYAAIMANGDTYRAFGRAGTGCVMGSKRLKGIVVTGDGVIEPGDKEKFSVVKRAIIANVRANSKFATVRRLYGTGNEMVQMSANGTLPTRNWWGGQFEGVAGISPAVTRQKWPGKNIPCGPHCPAPCSHYTEIDKGPYKGAHCDGPEYETLYAFGSNCGIGKWDAVVAAAQLCDENGLDTMSTGLTIGFAMECFEKELIGLKDTDGIDLRFGNDAAMMAALRKLVKLEGFGQRLALGTKRLSEQIPGSEGFAMHAKGLEFGGYECRGLMGQALQFAISNRGGCHHANGLPARTEVSDGTRMQIEGKGEQVKNLAIDRIVRDSLPLCTFVGMIVTKPLLPEIVSALYGEPWSTADLNQAGLRILCQERLFNMREGITRKNDILPSRLTNEPKPDGPTKGAVVPLETLKDDYYRALGWDLTTGNPADSLLDELEVQR